MIVIIAFAGLRKSGKTLAANTFIEIAQDYGVIGRKLSFADELREMFSKETGIAVPTLLDNERKEEFRYRLQRFSHSHREKNPFIFADSLITKILPKDELILIDDVRYIEELQRILENKGLVYKIDSNTPNRLSRGYVYNKEIDEHISETELGSLSAHTYQCLGGDRIFNNKSREHLRTEMFLLFTKHCLSIPV